MLPIFLHHTIKNGNVQERTDRNILNILTGISRIFLPKIIKIRQEKGCFLIRMLYVISYVQVFRCLPVWNEYCNNCHYIQTNWFDAGQQQIWTSALNCWSLVSTKCWRLTWRKRWFDSHMLGLWVFHSWIIHLSVALGKVIPRLVGPLTTHSSRSGR